MTKFWVSKEQEDIDGVFFGILWKLYGRLKWVAILGFITGLAVGAAVVLLLR